MRLNKYLAHCGVDSRRNCDQYVQRGRVQVNGEIEVNPARRVEPGDVVLFDGEQQKLEKHVYYKYHKPVGQASTLDDPHIKNTLEKVVAEVSQRIYPVGRLDADSRGLLLLTNDGNLSHRLSHPRYGIAKTYCIELHEEPTPAVLKIMSTRGVHLDGRQTMPLEVVSRAGKNLTVKLREGRNRQLRRMFEKFDYEIVDLLRTAIGPLELGDMRPGELKELDEETLEKIREEAYE
ncbi:MAG: pseudouridine synthase [bacterium]